MFFFSMQDTELVAASHKSYSVGDNYAPNIRNFTRSNFQVFGSCGRTSKSLS
jgi:hypothetical protein